MCEACSDFWYRCRWCLESRRGGLLPRRFFFGDTPCSHMVNSKPSIDLLYLSGLANYENEMWYEGRTAV